MTDQPVELDVFEGVKHQENASHETITRLSEVAETIARCTGIRAARGRADNTDLDRKSG